MAPGRASSQLPRKPEKAAWLCWDLGSLSREGLRGGEAAGRDLTSPLFSQDAHGEGCQRGHCLHFFCVGPWHPGHPGLWTGGQALHAGPIFTWDQKLSQKGLGKTSPSPLPYHTSKTDTETKHLRPRAQEYWGCPWCEVGSHLPLPPMQCLPWLDPCNHERVSRADSAWL